MGGFAPKGHAKVDPQRPSAFGHCDRCGFLYNHRDLRWDTQYAGHQLRRTGWLVCESCNDVPNPTLRPFTLPPDPVPILNPRREKQFGLCIRADMTKYYVDTHRFTVDIDCIDEYGGTI